MVFQSVLRAMAAIAMVSLTASCRPGPATSRAVPTIGPAQNGPPSTGPVIAGHPTITIANTGRLASIVAFDLPSSFVNALVFSPDNRSLITADRNREVIVWERGTWNRRTYQAAQGSIDADNEAQIHFYGTLALSPDGRTIVTTNPDGDVRGRDLAGNELFAISYGARVYSTAISPDGRYLAVAGVAGNIVVCDLATGRRVADLPSDREYVSALVFSPDGLTLLAAYERPRNLMATWRTTDWRETSTFSHVTERIDYHDVIYTPDGKSLVIASTGNDLEFLDMIHKQVVKTLSGHTSPPYQLAFSPDGSLLASVGHDGTLRVWNSATGDVLRVVTNSNETQAVAFSPDGTLLAFSIEGEGVQVWGVGR